MRTRIFKVRQYEAEEDCITKTHYSSNCFFHSASFLNNARDVLGGTNPIPSYLQICQKSIEFPKVAVGENRSSSLLLCGLRFYVLGTFGCTAAAVAGKKAKPNLAPQAMVEKWIHDLGGTVLTKDNAQTILRGHSKAPNCFLLLKDGNDLVKGTMTVEERLQNRVAKNESATDLESSDTGQKLNERAGEKTVTCCQPVS